MKRLCSWKPTRQPTMQETCGEMVTALREFRQEVAELKQVFMAWCDLETARHAALPSDAEMWEAMARATARTLTEVQAASKAMAETRVTHLEHNKLY